MNGILTAKEDPVDLERCIEVVRRQGVVITDRRGSLRRVRHQ
jgi:acetolactate synthase regulatory subunit